MTLKTSTGTIKGTGAAVTDGNGRFDWHSFAGSNNPEPVLPGDQVVVAAGAWSQTVVAPEIVGSANPETRKVMGRGPAESFVDIRPRAFNIPLRAPTATDGSFLVDYNGLGTVRASDEFEVGVYDMNWNRLFVVVRAGRLTYPPMLTR